MVKMDQIFFHPFMTIFLPIESPCQVDTRYAVFTLLKVLQSDYLTKNKKAYIAYNAYTKKHVRAPKKNVRICTQMRTISQHCFNGSG
jgi:hypothetical protein